MGPRQSKDAAGQVEELDGGLQPPPAEPAAGEQVEGCMSSAPGSDRHASASSKRSHSAAFPDAGSGLGPELAPRTGPGLSLSVLSINYPSAALQPPAGQDASSTCTLPGWDSRSICQGTPFRPPTGKLAEVFISHAGEQKAGFVDVLWEEFCRKYPVLKVFVDEHSMTKGEEAMPAINDALGDAFVVVVVLSKEFISKQYPMEELQLLLQWRAQGSVAKLLPVYHGITYEEVSCTIAQYQEAQEGTLEWQWAKDLSLLCNITGTRTDQVPTRRDTLLAKLVVQDAARALESMGKMPFLKPQEVPSIMVGLEGAQDTNSNKARVMSLLTDEKNRSMVLLHGMGGIGKTTLAKALFNELQQRNATMPCCFVRLDPNMEDPDQVVPKQREIWKQLAQLEEGEGLTTAEEGRQLLSGLGTEGKLEGQKVLLVVDNVWGSQLEWLLPENLMKHLGRGSMVLVTSREVTAAGGFRDGAGVKEVEMDCLSEEQSLELFCKHAYKRSRPPDGEEERVRGVVRRCAGLPMAVEVVGRHLAALKVKDTFWRNLEVALPRAFRTQSSGRKERESTLFDALMLSWEGLDGEEQDTLQDIVWFLQGASWAHLQSYCEYHVLECLTNKGLVKQSAVYDMTYSCYRVDVHDTIASFCKSVKLPDQRGQRVQLSGSLAKPLMEASFRGMWLRGCTLDGATCAKLSKMKGLRVLILTGCSCLPGDCLASPSLRWLTVESNPQQQQPHTRSLQLQEMPNLAVLILRKVAEVWGLQCCTNMNALQLDRCNELQSLDLEGLVALQQLDIRWCLNLQTVNLKGMTSLGSVTGWHCNSLAEMAGLEELGIIDQIGGGLLLCAAQYGHQGLVRQLLGAEADVNAQSYEGRTPLYIAAQNGHTEVVPILLGAGAAEDAADKDGWTALHWAARNGQDEIVQMLLGARAAVDAATNVGCTPLHKAAEYGQKVVVSQLLDAGAAVDAADMVGNTPADVCCTSPWMSEFNKAHKDVILAALTAAPKSHHLLSAVRSGDWDEVQKYLDAGKDINGSDTWGWTPLHLAAWLGHTEVVRQLLVAGAAVDAADKNRKTPLHWAAGSGDREVVGLLLRAGAVVDSATKDGRTPLYLASLNGHKEVVVQLLDAGATADAANDEGKTPAEVCCTYPFISKANNANKGSILAALAAPHSAPPAAPSFATVQEPRAATCREKWHWDPYQAFVTDTYQWDVFISHAGRNADKPFALQLWNLLAEPGIGLRVFLDEQSLHLGDDAGAQMTEAIKSARIRLPLLSREFFDREYTKDELVVMFERQALQRSVLLPVFLRMTIDECKEALKVALPGNSLEWPEGIRHQGEPSARAGNTHVTKSLGETMEQIAIAVCKICCGADWEQRYDAGLKRMRHRLRR